VLSTLQPTTAALVSEAEGFARLRVAPCAHVRRIPPLRYSGEEFEADGGQECASKVTEFQVSPQGVTPPAGGVTLNADWYLRPQLPKAPPAEFLQGSLRGSDFTPAALDALVRGDVRGAG